MCTIDKILSLMAEKRISQNDMCSSIGVSKQTFSNWKSGYVSSYVKYLPKIAERLNVSVDYLVNDSADQRDPGIKKDPSIPEGSTERSVTADDVKVALFGGGGEVTDEMWEEAKFAAQLIKERHKRKGAK